jgi:hypothetical protein
MVSMDRKAGGFFAVVVALLALFGGPVLIGHVAAPTSADTVELTVAPAVRAAGVRSTQPRLPSRPVPPAAFVALLAGALLAAPLVLLRAAARRARRAPSVAAPRLTLGRAPPLRVA